MVPLKSLSIFSLSLLSQFVNGVAIATTDTKSPALAASCPDSDGKIIVDANSKVRFYVQCATDRPGGDIPGPTPWVNSIEECIAACASTPDCVAAAYGVGTPGPCFLKSNLGFPNANGGIVTVFRDGGMSGLSCPSGANKKLVINADTFHTVKCFWPRNPEPDGFGVTVLSPSFEECLKSCDARRDIGCNFATFYPGQDVVRGQSVPAPGGKCVFSKKLSVAILPDLNAWWGVRDSMCPTRDGKTVLSEGISIDAPGRKYEIKCNSDWLENDLEEEPRQTDTLSACLNECDRRQPHCRGVVWSISQGTCFFKGGKPGVIVPSRPGLIRAKVIAK
ncbi:hypothetical protein BJ508DRAFT_414975 [Ascobolus immersus RN42]|uniref:Apple domain-containing protein n=1 Tax=Ascobolus immersus RN42 TaxID=1160509 RepID=A0A3N4IAA5_ASCIM|nr:hypothetical protein BJ508DRAFT_414975 [Ascobolus immersus RN42]